MLHIFLAILKVIGIIALVILGIILVLVLLVLFRPVRYDVHLKKEDGPFEANGKTGWLGRFVCADFCFTGKQGTVAVKICGKTLRVFHIPGNSGKETDPLRAKREKAPGKTAADAPDLKGETDPAEKPDPEGQARAGERTGTEKKEKPGEAAAPGEQAKMREHADPEEPGRQDAAGTAGSRRGKTFPAIAAELLLRALEAPSDLGDRLEKAADRADEKLRTLSGRAGPFLTPDAFALYRRLIGYVVRFLHTCRIRRLDGYVLIGTGKPDRTGEAVGFLYLVLPEAEGDYAVRADFYQKAFRTDTVLTGHIRLNHAAALAVRVIRDREFRTLLSHIRHKDGGAGRSGGRKKTGRRRMRTGKTGRKRKLQRRSRAAGGKKAA